MPNNIVTHQTTNDKINISGNNYTGLGIDKIIVGVANAERREVVVDEQSGYNYARAAIEAKEIYNFRNTKRGSWFILDLETGARGPKSWFPGCVIYGDTVDGIEVPIKQAPSEDSETLKSISKAGVQILNLTAINQEPYDEEYETAGWYRVLYDVQGYIKKEFLTNLRYVDPSNPTGKKI